MAKLRDICNRAYSRFATSSATLIEALEQTAQYKHIPKTVLTSAAMALTPYVRRELMISYNRSGLGKKSGNLFKAAVTQSVIEIRPDSLIISFPSGKSKRLYKYAGAWQYGAIRGSHGAKLSKSMKKALLSVKGQKVVLPKPYFTLNGSQIARLQERYARFIEQKIQAQGAK